MDTLGSNNPILSKTVSYYSGETRKVSFIAEPAKNTLAYYNTIRLDLAMVKRHIRANQGRWHNGRTLAS
jgi:hypothetical protein